MSIILSVIVRNEAIYLLVIQFRRFVPRNDEFFYVNFDRTNRNYCMGIPLFLQKALLRLPYFGRKLRMLNDCGYTPGHYYSPIPDLNDINNRKAEIFKKTNIDVKGIDLRKEEQFALLQEFSKYYKELPYDFFAVIRGDTNHGSDKTRYQVNGIWYKYSDAVMLYSIMRHFKPKKIVEAGSGYSSAIMLDVNELFLDSGSTFTFIDPYPERLLSLLKEEDKKQHKVIRSIVQYVDMEVFKALEANDILFIDSSHISKVGSDLNYILFEILPVLKPGVLIHFHDIFYPFEYNYQWAITENRSWNEIYMLRSFLSFNNKFKIVFFNDMMAQLRKDELLSCCPDFFCNTGGSFWLKRVEK